MFKLYQIICPITNLPIYVGITGHSLNERLKSHHRDVDNIEKYIYLNYLKGIGLPVKIEQLMVLDDEEVIRWRERELIESYHKNGMKLLNRHYVVPNVIRKPKKVKPYKKFVHKFIARAK